MEFLVKSTANPEVQKLVSQAVVAEWQKLNSDPSISEEIPFQPDDKPTTDSSS